MHLCPSCFCTHSPFHGHALPLLSSIRVFRFCACFANGEKLHSGLETVFSTQDIITEPVPALLCHNIKYKNSRCNLLKNNYACIVRLMRHMQNRKWHPTLTDEPSMLANALDTRKSVVSRCSVKTDQTGCPIACLPLSDLCIKACPCLVSLHCRARAALDIKPETKLDAEKPAQTVPQCSLCKSLCGKLQMANNTLILRMAKPHARTCQAQLSYLAHLKCCLDTCPVSIHAEGPKTFH